MVPTVLMPSSSTLDASTIFRSRSAEAIAAAPEDGFADGGLGIELQQIQKAQSTLVIQYRNKR